MDKDPLGTIVTSLILPVFLVVVAVAGLLMTAIIVDIRFEAIMYARTINVIRKYFKDTAADDESANYFVLPDSDAVPRFNEQPMDLQGWQFKWRLVVGATFLEVVLMGIIDSLFLAMGLFLLFQSSPWQLAFILATVIWVFYFLLHVSGYIYFANKRDTEWVEHAAK